MAISNHLVLFQATFFILVLVLAVCEFLPITFHLFNFKGHCLLFTNGTWRGTDGQFMAEWSSQAYCDVAIAWGLIAVAVSLIQMHRFINYLCSATDTSFLGAFLDCLISGFMFICSLCIAIMMTLGYQEWCDAIMQRFEQCQDASSNNILKDEGIDTTMFYTQFGTAQFGAWSLWVCFVGLLVVSLLKLCKYHQTENIRSSMARDRARLISEQRENGHRVL
ncbi:UNVERIFIED_CONTAM: hypothetical protein RMT77_002838 [Armadillidium vulgare]|nr:Transmembrane protein [Armadillidium vulgare]